MYYYLIQNGNVIGMTDSPESAPEGFEVLENETYIDPSSAILGANGLEVFTPGVLISPPIANATLTIPQVLFDWSRDKAKTDTEVLTEFTIALYAVTQGDLNLLQGALEELKTLFKADQPESEWSLIE